MGTGGNGRDPNGDAVGARGSPRTRGNCGSSGKIHLGHDLSRGKKDPGRQEGMTGTGGPSDWGAETVPPLPVKTREKASYLRTTPLGSLAMLLRPGQLPRVPGWLASPLIDAARQVTSRCILWVRIQYVHPARKARRAGKSKVHTGRVTSTPEDRIERWLTPNPRLRPLVSERHPRPFPMADPAHHLSHYLRLIAFSRGAVFLMNSSGVALPD
jgi:hypothetical protein